MEEKDIGEQLPESVDAQENVDMGALQSPQGSSLGKFKDAESLLDAYNNLQAEFTKKCQKLSEFEKKYESGARVFENENWNNAVADFFEKHDKAKQFSREIANLIFSDESINRRPDALELAWAKVASENFRSPQDFLADKSFIERAVLEDETLKTRLLEKIVAGLSGAPPVIGGNGKNVSAKQPSSPKTLSEAKEILKTMF